MIRGKLRAALALLSLSCDGDTTAPAAGAQDAGRCATQSGTVEAGKLADPELKEASGLAASVSQADLLWSTNDSGDSARLFALGKNGAARGQLHLDGIKPADVEDIALVRDGSGKSYLFAADIGDNLTARSHVAIYRMEEPLVAATLDIHVTPEVMTVTYADGVPHNAETLLVDPRSAELFIVTKAKPAARLFRIGAFAGGTDAVAKDVGEIPVDTATGGAFAPDGKSVIVRDYSGTAQVWSVGAAQSLQDAIKSAPCAVSIGLDLQGEAICFDTDSRRIFTTSEGAHAPLHLTEPTP